MQRNFLIGRNLEANLLDPAEVEANRRGEITPAQKARLNGMVLGGQGCAVFIVPFFVFPFLCVIFPVAFTGEWIGIVVGLVLVLIVGAVLVGMFFPAIGNWSRLQRDKAAGMMIRQAVGELEFDRRRRYVVRAGERTLSLPAAKNIGGLLPGLRYTVFHLEESGFVLSAEQMGAMSEPAVKSALQTVLMQVNRFTFEDLQANKQGEITPAQRTRALLGASGMLLFIIVPLLVGGAVFVPLLNDGFTGETIFPMLFMGGMIVLFMAIGLYSFTRIALDVMDGAPQVLKGTGRKHSETRSTGKSRRTDYYYIIGGTRIQVTQVAYTAFIDDLEYNIYFLPRTKKLLSIEPIDVPDDY